MNYCLNEYSLHGQFKDIDEFCKSMRDSTLPLLNYLQRAKHNVIWNRDILFYRRVVGNLELRDIRSKLSKQNRKDSSLTELNRLLLKFLSNSKTTWSNLEVQDFEIVEYLFDINGEAIDKDSCFYKVITLEGDIISFKSEFYKYRVLKIRLQQVDADGSQLLEREYDINNISDISNIIDDDCEWRWHLECVNCMIEVRPREFEYHSPHFHAESGDFKAVFSIKDGSFITGSKAEVYSDIMKAIAEWYANNKENVIRAWDFLHGSISR